MARSKQTARRTLGGKPPRRIVPQFFRFDDHTGRPYTTVTNNSLPNKAICKLSLHLYCLQDLDCSPDAMGKCFLSSRDICNAGNMRNYWPRVDVYSPLSSIEECMQHHLREKAFRRKAVEDLHKSAASTAAAEAAAAGGDEVDVAEAAEEAVLKLRGKEPLPHIVPAWCCSPAFWKSTWYSSANEMRYRSFILVVPEGCKSWDDVVQQGLYFVYFDQQVTPEMETDMWDEPEDEGDSMLGEDRQDYDPVNSKNNNFDGTLQNMWYELFRSLNDCTYRRPCCDGCDNDEEVHECELELNEHYFDEDGQCIACRRFLEHRRRSKRLSKKRRAEESEDLTRRN
ncbi:hypothetical protein BGW36DRAFT_393891 [Talaromyces proteolyticus]|uniref:Uncharacterized protein n=1 Tax=Talaromyces proteolyticus TaxID=1131652 RepID=A0AAD4Q2E6_9EURO|nr:uncharacterized protein BGW36DRAFT_393891 [Talaromyces proteolyticus]KAH8703607.1 hypothetical protein BGW36DRAFT_393891 [Talaromyces proteolyticus]